MALRSVTRGCYHRQGWPPNATCRTLISGFVAEPGWSQLQSTQNGPIIHPNPIDDALDLIRGDPNGLKMKIRLGRAGGYDHPSWLATLCGTARMVEPRDNRFPAEGVDIVCWWKDAYITAYTDLLTRLAAEYDSDVDFPEILEITMSQGRTFYMEPFIRQISAKVTNPDGTVTYLNAEPLLTAGYTPEKNNASMLAAIEAHAVFKSIRTSIAISPNQYYNPADEKGYGEKFTNASHSVVCGRHMRRVLGRRAVLGNNAYTSPLKSPAALYTFLESMGAPMYYQTENPTQLGLPGPGGELKDTRLQSMNESRNNMIEMPGAYPYGSIDKATGTKNPDDTLSDAELASWDDDLWLNVTETTPTAPGNFTATVASSSQVDFTWDYPTAGLGIIEFRIYQDGALKKTVQSYPDAKVLSTSVTGLAAGTTSTWTVRAYNGVESVDSAALTRTTSGTSTDTTSPTPATLTSAVENTTGGVDLAWTAASDASGIARYEVERDGAIIDVVTTLTYTDVTPDAGAKHTYRVWAYDPAGNGAVSNALSVQMSGGEAPPAAEGWVRHNRRRPWR